MATQTKTAGADAACNAASCTDAFQTAIEGFRHAMEAGVKFQQDAWKMMTQMPIGMGAAQDLQHNVSAAAQSAVEAVRRNMISSQKLFEETSRGGMDLLNACFESARGGEKIEDRLQAAQRMWKSTFQTLQSNTEAIAKANVGMIENVSQFASTMANGRSGKSSQN
jgi:hypothetical protein